MKIPKFDKIDIIGGNVSGLCAGIELAKKKIPYTIYEREIWDKPCGGGFGKVFLKYLKENNVQIKINRVKTSIFASKYSKIEEIPYDFYITKRRHLQQELMKKIPESQIRIQKVEKKDISNLSKIIFVATGISGVSKYLLKKNFPGLSRYQYYLLSSQDYPAWDPSITLFYFIPEIRGYAWIFPTIDGLVDIGIGGYSNSTQKQHFEKFLNWLNRNYDLRLSKKLFKMNLTSWGIPMWSNQYPRKVIHFDKQLSQLRVGLGDAIDLPQVVSAGGIENAITSSQLLVNSLDVYDKNTLNIELNKYLMDIYNSIPLRSNTISIRLVEKVVYSNFLIHPLFTIGGIGNKVGKRISAIFLNAIKN